MRYPPDHKEKTRARILDAASRVFRREGYEGAGVDALMAEAGLTSGAFYGHFESKEDLLTEVVRRSVKENESLREAGLDGLEGREWVRALIRRYLSREHWQTVDRGCPMPTLISELGRASDPPKQAFAEAVEQLIDRMEQRLAPQPHARETVMVGLAMAVGGMALARAVGDRDLATTLLEACAGRGVDRLLAADEGHADE